MGDAPRDLSGSRGTTGPGEPGRYSFGEDAGQQGTGPSVGLALPEYGNNLDAATPPNASGAMASGGPGPWAIPTTGTGISGAPGAQTWGGPGQWASPTTGTGISSVSFAQPGTGRQGGNASGTTSTGGPGQGASPTTGSGNTGSVGTGVMPAGMASLPTGMGPGGMGGQGPAGQLSSFFFPLSARGPTRRRNSTGRNTFGTFLGGNGTENTPDVFRHDNCEQLGT